MGTGSVHVPDVVLFPYDPYCIPFVRGLRVHLEAPTREGRVIERGPPGSTDAHRVQYYGTVIRVGDEFRMWYLGLGDREGEDGRAHDLFVCYATSQDGVSWEKPSLGLVEYGGSTHNNRVLIRGLEESDRHYAAVILYEPEDPDPSRRFKMVLELAKYHGQLSVAYSADGLEWDVSPNNPVGPLIEMSGLTKVDDTYMVCGQGGTAAGRKMEILVSKDFEHWPMAPATPLNRERHEYDHNRSVNPWMPPILKRPEKENHIGAGLWNRGNVILAFYGDYRWNPLYEGERKHVRINIGFMTSPDGLHYHEPVPDIPIMSAAENWIAEEEWDARLLQGQGFENIGEKTCFWYGVAHTGAYLATWPRDRMACVRCSEYGNTKCLTSILGTPHFISCPIDPGSEDARVYLNVDLASEHAAVTVELVDDGFVPLPEYSGENAIPITESGLHVPVKWKNKESISGGQGGIRVQVNYGGVRLEDVSVYAVYLERK